MRITAHTDIVLLAVVAVIWACAGIMFAANAYTDRQLRKLRQQLDDWDRKRSHNNPHYQRRHLRATSDHK